MKGQKIKDELIFYVLSKLVISAGDFSVIS
jgi:hypothetical protein